MYIEFQKLSLKNLMGFGSNTSELTFDINGIFLLSGPNGSGKSTVLAESLSFALFGKPYRKTKMTELINRYNKKNLLVTVQFKINNDIFVLERGLKPNVLTITKNNETIDILSTKMLTQDEIDKILGINYDMFKNIIALSLSYNKSFLTIPAMDKRSYIENVFNIKIFSDMLSLIKKENVDIRMSDDINSRALLIMENNMKSFRSNIKNIKNTVANFEKDKKQEIKVANLLISKVKTTINDSNNYLSKHILTEYQEEEILNKNKLKEVTNKISQLNYQINTISENLKFYIENEICHTCGVLIDPQKKIDNIAKNTVEQAELTKEYKALFKESKSLETKISKISNQIEAIKNKNSELLYLNKELIGYEEQLHVSENRELTSIDLDALYKELEEKSKEYSDLYITTNESKNTIRINNIIQAILQDDGIKTYFIHQLLPILNERINHYLNKFEIPLLFTFNERLEESIKSLDYNNDISYYSHSEGEKRKIDIALTLSFIDITKRISGWSCNLLIIDELLDSALDGDALSYILDSIKIVQKESNSSIYLISHRDISDDTFFNGNILIEKKDGFSTIVQTFNN